MTMIEFKRKRQSRNSKFRHYTLSGYSQKIKFKENVICELKIYDAKGHFPFQITDLVF